MTELISGAVAIFAVLLGGLASYLASSRTEQKRWAREQSSRWDVRRLEAIVEFSSAVKVETRIALRIAKGRGVEVKTDPLELEIGREAYSVAESTRSALLEAVVLLSDDETVRSAREWQFSVWSTYHYAAGDETPQTSEFNAMYKIAGEHREAFYAAAKRSLNIHPSSGSNETANVLPTLPGARY
jgi:hypothetical protein